MRNRARGIRKGIDDIIKIVCALRPKVHTYMNVWYVCGNDTELHIIVYKQPYYTAWPLPNIGKYKQYESLFRISSILGDKRWRLI